MLRGMYTAASGMKLQQSRQENITQNISNVNTTSFKRELIISKSSFSKLLKNKDEVFKNTKVNELGTLELGVEIDEKNINYNQGILEETNSNLDFAIEGSGFFAIEGEDGTYYTRDGNFKLDGVGRLVTNNGDLVLGEDVNTGEVKYITANDGKLQLDNKGTINGDTNLIVRDFEDYNSLEKVGHNLYSVRYGNILDGNNYTLRQGYLEKSNVDILEEMVNMIEVSRMFQTNSRVLQSYDDTLGKAVNEIGRIG